MIKSEVQVIYLCEIYVVKKILLYYVAMASTSLVTMGEWVYIEICIRGKKIGLKEEIRLF